MLALLLAVVCVSCASNPNGCPRAGLDSPRRCKRLCVVGPGHMDTPLPCTCMAECLCWQMSGHPRRAAESEETSGPYR